MNVKVLVMLSKRFVLDEHCKTCLLAFSVPQEVCVIWSRVLTIEKSHGLEELHLEVTQTVCPRAR